MAASADTQMEHASLCDECGICGQIVENHEPFIALLGDTASATFLSLLNRATWNTSKQTRNGQSILLNGYVLCRAPGCLGCLESNSKEAGIVHDGCLQIVFRESSQPSPELVDRLWLEAAWRRPWRSAPSLRLPEKITTFKLPPLSMLSDLDLTTLSQLPPEIIDPIRELSSDAMFWRYSKALEFASQVNASVSSELVSLHFHQLLSWHRGGDPITTTPTSDVNPVVRITIDRYGIQKIERVSLAALQETPFKTPRTDTEAFVVLTDEMREGTMHFKLGRAQLQVFARGISPRFGRLYAMHSGQMYAPAIAPDKNNPLHIWDTPNPPLPLKWKTLMAPSVNKGVRLSTSWRSIDLQNITGITFIYERDRLMFMHAHTPASPCAMETLERSSRRGSSAYPFTAAQDRLVWTYIPISSDDHVLMIKIIDSFHNFDSGTAVAMLFRTSLAGDILVGHCEPIWDVYRFSRASASRRLERLMYGQDELGFIRSLAVDHEPKIPSEPTDAVEEPNEKNDDLEYRAYSAEFPLPGSLMSRAPLADVTRARVYYTPDGEHCRGILFEYANGAQRTVGECRVGVASYQTCENPAVVCYSHTVVEDPSSEDGSSKLLLRVEFVSFTSSTEYADLDSPWKYSHLRHSVLGSVKEILFWFGHQQALMDIVDMGDASIVQNPFEPVTS